MRPCLPRESQVTSEPGPPERSGTAGAGLSASVSWLTAAKVLLSTDIAPLATTPSSTATSATATSTPPATTATRAGSTLVSSPATHLVTAMTARTSATRMANTTTATTRMIGYDQIDSPETPMRVRNSSCQPANQISMSTVPATPIPASTHQVTTRVGRGCSRCSIQRMIAATSTPSP